MSVVSGNHSPAAQRLVGQGQGQVSGQQQIGKLGNRLVSPVPGQVEISQGASVRGEVRAAPSKPGGGLALRDRSPDMVQGERAAHERPEGVEDPAGEGEPFQQAAERSSVLMAANLNTLPNAEGGLPNAAARRQRATELGKEMGSYLEKRIQGIQSGSGTPVQKRADIESARADHDSLLKTRMGMLWSRAPRGQGLGQITALRAGVAQGRQAVLGEKQLEATVASATQRHADRHLGTSTDFGTWHRERNNALASNHKHETPHEFRMNFSLKHHAFWGASDFKGKVDVALKHLHAKEDRIKTLGGDMRPYMQAGIELALRNGSQHITPKQAIALLETLCAQAGDPTNEHCLQPDLLRMVVAGMVAVWDPQVSAEVALHLLNKNQDGGAQPKFAEGDQTPLAARDLALKKWAGGQSQRSTVAEGLGLGMAWKGMALIEQYADGMPSKDRAEKFADLREAMRHGQSEGKHWLLRMEMALPGLSGKKNTDLVAQMEAVVLMRRFYIKHEPYVPSSTSSSTPVFNAKRTDETSEMAEGEGDYIFIPAEDASMLATELTTEALDLLRNWGTSSAQADETTPPLASTHGNTGTFARAPSGRDRDDGQQTEGVPNPGRNL